MKLAIYIYICVYIYMCVCVKRGHVHHREMASDQVNVVGFLQVGIVGRNGTRNYTIINIIRPTSIFMQQGDNEGN
jgi:hypothetical protein